MERVADRPHVAVCGSGDTIPEIVGLAEEVGAELARRGAVVVCGGLGGVMEGACRGAKEAGGTTVGILPGRDRSAANPWVDVAIATGMDELRNGLVVASADALIAVCGGLGTLTEIAFALKAGKPVVGIGTWWIARNPDDDPEDYVDVDDPREAVRLALEAAASAH
ncbi:MAG TPA: TIGR00725 family protein [Conexibacter sp.]|nr:TIGR00725 family protein [Conexibacter sp.]